MGHLLFLSASVGHFALGMAAVNRVHATGMPMWISRGTTWLIQLVAFGLPCALAGWLYGDGLAGAPARWETLPWGFWTYAVACSLVAAGPFIQWILDRLKVRPPRHLKSEERQIVDVIESLGRRPLGDGPRKMAATLPRNDAYDLEINEKHLVLPGMHPALDGLSIAHLSDLHFSGTVTRDYFNLVVDLTNDMKADVVAVTGDLIDRAHCLPWVSDVLGRLSAPYGVYVVLGNHDQRVPVPRLLEEIRKAGMVHLGGRTAQIAVAGRSVLLAGDERPWFRHSRDFDSMRLSRDADRPLSILLAHTPDRIGWARRRQFDMVLAGHCHGGQITMPGFGPIVAPSHHGVKYAGGTYFESPTLLHVSRGVSGLLPYRFRCRPEITRLVLCAPVRTAAQPELEAEGVVRGSGFGGRDWGRSE